MPSTQKEIWRITARGPAFSKDEVRLFNHAIMLFAKHSRSVAMFVEGRARGLCRMAAVGPFRIDLTTIDDGPRQHKVEIDIAHEGRQVLLAAYEQWRRPKRRHELSILYEVPVFFRGDWERKFLHLH